MGQVRPGIKESAGRKKGNGASGHGNHYLARILGEAAVSASRTDTFLGERYRRIARRRGKQRAIVAVGRSILVIIWHLLAEENTPFHDLGPDYYDSRVNLNRKMRNHGDCPTNGVSGPTRRQGRRGRLVTDDRHTERHELYTEGSQEDR
ncbi:MAG: hypothetical protein ABI336_13215 [Humibacillus sp.]